MADIAPLLSLIQSQARYMGLLYEDGTVARKPIPVTLKIENGQLSNSAPIAFPKFTTEGDKKITQSFLATGPDGDVLLRMDMPPELHRPNLVIAWDTGEFRLSMMGVEAT